MCERSRSSPASRLVRWFVFASVNDSNERVAGPLSRALQKGERLRFGQTLEKEETQRHIKFAVEFHFLHVGQTQERFGRFFGVVDRPCTVIEAPRFFAALA